MKVEAARRGYCPYYLSRHLIHFANVIIFSYQVRGNPLLPRKPQPTLTPRALVCLQYIMDPKIAAAVSKEISSSDSTILVFDEAHNIDNVAIEVSGSVCARAI